MVDVKSIGGFNQRQGEALPPQIFLTLSRFVFTVQTCKIGSVYSQENYRNCWHLMSDFKAKKVSLPVTKFDIGTPLWEITALPRPPADPIPLSALSGPRNNLPPQICIPKSAYGKKWIVLPLTSVSNDLDHLVLAARRCQTHGYKRQVGVDDKTDTKSVISS